VTWLSHRPGRVAELGFSEDDVHEIVFEYHDESGSWVEEVSVSDAVVNLSGTPIAARWNAQVKHLLRESRIDTTRAIVDAIVMAREGELPGDGPRVLVSASAVGVYGDRSDELLPEDSLPGDDFLAQLAVDWESEAMRATRHETRVAIPRIGIVLGSEGIVPRLKTPFRFFVGGPVGSGSQYVPWVHVDDIAGIFRHAIENESVAGPVNTAPAPVQMKEFAREFGHAMKRPSWFPVPEFALRLVLGEVAPYTLYSQRAEPAVLDRTGYAWRHPDLPEALACALSTSEEHPPEEDSERT
jgi:uncharacterized protein (TIGR01777 family)